MHADTLSLANVRDEYLVEEFEDNPVTCPVCTKFCD